MTIAEASEFLYGGAILVLILIMFAGLIRAIRGPEIADRIVAVNMLGTLTIMIICILSLWQNESYLLDVALIYAMISFLAVVVLTRVYLGVHREHVKEKSREAAEAQQMETSAVMSTVPSSEDVSPADARADIRKGGES